MDDRLDQIRQLQYVVNCLYHLVAMLRCEIAHLQGKVRDTNIGITLLNNTLLDLDTRYQQLRIAHDHLLRLYNTRLHA